MFSSPKEPEPMSPIGIIGHSGSAVESFRGAAGVLEE